MGKGTPLFIPLGSGIETDVEDRLLPVGKAIQAENLYVKTSGNLTKRFGHLAQPSTIQPSGVPLPQAWQLAKYRSARVNLSISPANPLAIYSPNQSAWDSITTSRRASMTTSITKMPNAVGTIPQSPRIAFGAGYFWILYADSVSSTMHVDVIDSTTRQLVRALSFTVANIGFFDIAFCNGFAVAVAADLGANNIAFFTVTPSTMAASTTNFGAVMGGSMFDIMVKNATTISVVYATGAIVAAAVDFVPSTLVTTGWGPRDSAGAAFQCAAGVAWAVDLGGSGKQTLAAVSSVNGVQVHFDFPAAGATRNATTTYNADPATTVNVAFIEVHTITSAAAGEFQVTYTIPAAPITNNVTKMAQRFAGVLTTGFTLYRSLSLLSKAFAYQGDLFCLFSYPADTDANSYAMRLPITTVQPATAAPQAIFGVGSTGNLSVAGNLSSTQLPQVINTSTGHFITAILYLARIGKDASGSYGSNVNGIELVDLSFIDPAIPTSTGVPIEGLDSLFIPGSPIGQFDGVTYSELGFAYQPPQGVLTAAAGGAMTPSTTYWYSFVFAQMDARGKLWRSAPSVPQSVALGGGNNAVTVSAPTLRITGRSNVVIEVYRGAANDPNFFQKVGQVNNSLTVDTVNFSDTFSDTQLAGGEDLYTTDGILPNTTIPGSPFVFMFQNRLCFVSADDPTEMWFSNQSTPTNGVRFNTQNIVRVADERGGMYGAGTMNDKVVLLKQSAIYAFSGDGPDDAGGGAFPPPQIVALGIGCTQPRSIVSQKDGVMFDSQGSKSGLQMINSGLSLSKDKDGMPFGAAVQRYQNETIVSAILIPEQSQIRWYCRSGRVLVYDLVFGVWTTFLLNTVGASVLSALAVDGAALVATDAASAANATWFEDTTGVTYTDNNQNQTVSLATPWVQLGSPNGFERLKKMIGSGKTVGDHTLTIKQYVNIDDSIQVGQKTFAETVANTPLWNWEWIPRVQRMSAVKLVLSENSATAGFESEGVTMLPGARSGLNRQPTTTRGP